MTCGSLAPTVVRNRTGEERRMISTRLLAFAAALAVIASAPAARADAVTDWNQTAVRATEIAGAPVPVQTRAMSIVHAAMFDAVNAVVRKYTLCGRSSRARASRLPGRARAAGV